MDANSIVVLQPGTDAWHDLVRAVDAAISGEHNRKVSINVSSTVGGAPLVAFKVGEGMWTAHRPVERPCWTFDDKIRLLALDEIRQRCRLTADEQVEYSALVISHREERTEDLGPCDERLDCQLCGESMIVGRDECGEFWDVKNNTSVLAHASCGLGAELPLA